jgi:hypothetical protein
MEDTQEFLEIIKSYNFKNLPGNPYKLVEKSGWIEISDPNEKSFRRLTFKNPITGQIVDYDKADPRKEGYAGKGHYHCRNPLATGNDNKYIDPTTRLPIRKGHSKSHILPMGSQINREMKKGEDYAPLLE